MSTEARTVRTDEVKLTKEDEVAPNIRIFGRSDDMFASDSNPSWQIGRISRTGTITTKEWALKGSFAAKWSDRTSYFNSVAPSSDLIANTEFHTNTISSVNAVISGDVTDYDIDFLSLPTAATAYLFTFPVNTKAFAFHNRKDGSIKVSKDALFTKFLTLFPGQPLRGKNIDNSPLAFYLKSPKANQEVEILIWT